MTEGRRGSRLRVGQLFALSIGLLVVFAVAGFLSGTAALASLRHARSQVVDHIDPALFASDRFLIDYVDQETGVRGFALGGDDGLLQPYREGRVRAASELDTVRRLSGNRRELGRVAEAARAWSTGYAVPAIAAVRAGKPTVRDSAEVVRGKQLFDALRVQVAGLERALGRERRVARDTLHSSAGHVRAVVIGFALAIFAAVLATAVVLRRTVVSPIGRLAGQVRGVALGNFEQPVEVGGAREVAALGADVDAMRARIMAELAALATARDELQRSNTELEQFAYVASHDLQEPLRKVASFTQMLQRRYSGQLDDRADTYIEFAVDGAKRMQDLINDLLAFSRVGRFTEPATEVDCNDLVQHALASLSEQVTADGARIEVGDLPSVRGEATLLEVVFANLISNGIKFHGDDPPLVEVSAERQSDFWCFTVRDNGIGIEPDYADRIFVIFQRLHPRSQYDGTGIGLAMCRKIIEYHGGEITLEQDGGGPGTTFTFTLPVIEETPA